jgi:hypothetical protein
MLPSDASVTVATTCTAGYATCARRLPFFLLLSLAFRLLIGDLIVNALYSFFDSVAPTIIRLGFGTGLVTVIWYAATYLFSSIVHSLVHAVGG